MHDVDRWLDQHPNITVVMPDQPVPGSDWRAEEGYGWIFKAWFRTWGESRRVMEAIRAEGWEPKFWGRKIRVPIADGFDGHRLAEFVMARWPDARIQLRCD